MSSQLAGESKAPPSPPPAPPLPPQRQGFVANAFARVTQPFGYGFRSPSGTGHRLIDRTDSRLSVQTSSSLLSSRSTSHKTGIPIAALDISPDRTHAVLAGHNILKTIQVSDSACAEDFNLRTSIIAYAATHEASGTAVAAKHKEQWRANDVKWSHGQYSSTIATAAANGQIVIYDINRTGVEIARLHEHSRQVHRLGFNPYKGQLMLSGSQDGTVRLWDLRDLAGDRSVMTCQSRRRFSGNSDGIRDVKWSPADGMEFALGTDNGVIQRWDFRNDKTPLLRVSAHENKSCHSIDWHSDGKHLASGGADKNIRVWDFSSSDRRKKHIWEIRAPQAVHNVRWRPPCWSSDKYSPSRWQCTQIATSYDQQDPRIHIWDFRRPFVPFRSLDRYETPATALLWHSEDLLWSVGTAGMFTQTDINFVPKTMDHRSPNTLAIAATGQILFFSQKRERRRTSIEDVLEDLHRQNQRRDSAGERMASTGTAQESSEEPSMLNSSLKYRHRRNPVSSRSTRSSTGTPPPAAGSTGAVATLDLSLSVTKMQRLSQVAAIGRVEGLFDAEAFESLARDYKIPEVPTRDIECNLHHILRDALRANATCAAKMNQHRLSQSWLIMAEAVEQELGRRAENGYQQRMRVASPEHSAKKSDRLFADDDAESFVTDSGTKRARPYIEGGHARWPYITGEHKEWDASDMTTPLARRLPDVRSEMAPTRSTTESLQLPNATWSKQPVTPVVGVSEISKLTVSEDTVKKDDPHRKEQQPETPSLQNNSQLASDASSTDMDLQMAVTLKPIVHSEDFRDYIGLNRSTMEKAKGATTNISHKYRLSDFIPEKQRPEYLRPWHASSMFEQLIDFHTYMLYDAQVPTFLLLHLGRWLHYSISYERAMLILSHYHRQLTDLELYIPATELRKLAGPEFPEIAEYGTNGIAPGGAFCTKCRKPAKGDNPFFCERCKEFGGQCPICNNMGPISSMDAEGVSRADTEAPAGLWTWCQACGHGGHMTCMSVWWGLEKSEGACPTLGCLCDCQPGSRRKEVVTKLEKKREEAKPGVAVDEWKAAESAAAQRARGLVGGSGLGPLTPGGGRGAMSLAAAGRSGSGGKKVRIVIPDEQGKETGGESITGGKTSGPA